MNRSDLVSLFRQKVGDTVSPYNWSESFIVDLLNEAVDEACIRARLLFDDETEDVCVIDVTVGVDTYVLDPAIAFISKAYLVDSSDEVVELAMVDRDELDRNVVDWRISEGDPEYLIVDELEVQIVPPPEEDFTLKLECYRIPFDGEKLVVAPGTGEDITDSAPVISSQHHRRLVAWPLSEVLDDADGDLYNPVKANSYMLEFENYFGKSPGFDRFRKRRKNRPHVNKCW